MQMKNVNLLQNSSEHSRSSAPPLPPRAIATTAAAAATISGSTSTAIISTAGSASSSKPGRPLSSSSVGPLPTSTAPEDPGLQSKAFDDSQEIGSVPMLKPMIPPPYRQPPYPSSAVGYGVVGTPRPSSSADQLIADQSVSPVPVPGSSQTDPIYVTHSSKFPVRSEMTRPLPPSSSSRIPHLSDVFRQQRRARMANSVTPDTGVQIRSHQAWTKEEKSVERSPSSNPTMTAAATETRSNDGEPLLLQTSSGSHSGGLDNHGAELCYIPSQPHQRPVGKVARGNLLLERHPEVSGDASELSSLYRAKFVTTGGDGPTEFAPDADPKRAIHSSMQNLKGSMLSIHSAAGRLQLDGDMSAEGAYATRAEVASDRPSSNDRTVLPPPQQFCEPSDAGDESVRSAYERVQGRYYHLKDMLSGGGGADDDDQQSRSQSVEVDSKSVVKGGRGAIYGLSRQGATPSVRNMAQKFEDIPEPVKPTAEDAAVDDGKSLQATETESRCPEWTDTVEHELRQILDVKLQMAPELPSRSTVATEGRYRPVLPLHQHYGSVPESTFSDSFSVTPPLPPLSPSDTPPALMSRRRSPTVRRNDKCRPQSSGVINMHKSSGTTPDILETTRKGPFRSEQSQQRLLQVTKGRQATPGSAKYLAVKQPTISNGGSGSIGTWNGGTKRPAHHFRVPLTGGMTTVPSALHAGRQQLRGSQISLGTPESTHDGEVTSTTTGLDMDSLLDDADLSTDVSSQTSHTADGEQSGEMVNIRRQLESLETMYSEVMRMLGVKGEPRFGSLMGQRSLNDLRPSRSRKTFGSTSSLATGKSGGGSGVRPNNTNPASKDSHTSRTHDRKHRPRESKVVGRRFQRLESHVVTLARSVAHLSSEMRSQHVVFQEMDSLRQQVAQLTAHQAAAVAAAAAKTTARWTGGREWDTFRSSIPSLTNPTRIKKLTKFFGEEPPLLRLFLKKLGYEKYAPQFEKEQISAVELPYLTEELLQKIGIPMGPRMRILQEAQQVFRQEHFNIYIV